MCLHKSVRAFLGALLLAAGQAVSADTAQIQVDIKLLSAEDGDLVPSVLLLEFDGNDLRQISQLSEADRGTFGPWLTRDVDVQLAPGSITYPILAIGEATLQNNPQQRYFIPLSMISDSVPITSRVISQTVNVTTLDKLSLASHFGWREEPDGRRPFSEITSGNVQQFLEFSQLIMAYSATDAEMDELFSALAAEVRTLDKFDNESAAAVVDLLRRVRDVIVERRPEADASYLRTMVELLTGAAAPRLLDVKIFVGGQDRITSATAREFATTEMIRVMPGADSLMLSDLNAMLSDIQEHQRLDAALTDSCLRIALPALPFVHVAVDDSPNFDRSENRGFVIQILKSVLDCVQTQQIRRNDGLSMNNREAGLCMFRDDPDYWELFLKLEGVFRGIADRAGERPFASNRTIDIYFQALGGRNEAFWDDCGDLLADLSGSRSLGRGTR